MAMCTTVEAFKSVNMVHLFGIESLMIYYSTSEKLITGESTITVGTLSLRHEITALILK